MNNELNQLRIQIDAIDQQIVSLLKQRSEVVHQIGKIKVFYGLPIYDPMREIHIFAAKRSMAENLGLSPQLIEDILRRIMRESYASEQDLGFKCLKPDLKYIVIISDQVTEKCLFTHMLTLSGYHVISLGAQDLQVHKQEFLSSAQLIMINVATENFATVLDDLTNLPANCIVCDFGLDNKSENLIALQRLSVRVAVSLLPVFNTNTNNMAKQLILYSDTNNDPKQYQWLLDQFKLWGVKLINSDIKQGDHFANTLAVSQNFFSLLQLHFLKEQGVNLENLEAISSPSARLYLIQLISSCDNKLLWSKLSTPQNTMALKGIYEQFSSLFTLISNGKHDALVSYSSDLQTWLNGGDNSKLRNKSQDLLKHIVDMI